MRLFYFALGLLVCLPGCASPDINARFKDPNLDVNQWVSRWESESREIYANRQEIVSALGLTKGMRVADVGAGTGIFTEPLSKAVGPGGRVYALDISPRFVQYIDERARQEGLNNVTTILSSEKSVELPSGSVDVVLMCDSYHHFTYPKDMLRSIRNALRPGGTLVIIDFERIPGESREWVLNHMRAGKNVFRREIEEAGFAFREEVEIGGFRENYFLRFERQ